MSGITRGKVLDLIVASAVQEPGYREALLADPKKALATLMNQTLAASLKVKVVEETADTIYLIAPYVAPADGDELSDDELERVAGGKGGPRYEDDNHLDDNLGKKRSGG